MARKAGTGKEYNIGYGRPPLETRFSSVRQPQRRHKPLQLPRKSTLDLGAERVRVRDGSGREIEMSADKLIDEMMIEGALRGSLQDCRDLYELLDAEEDRMLADPLARISRNRQRQMREMLRIKVQNLHEEAQRLVDLGIACRTSNGGLQLQSWVRQALRSRSPS